MFLAHLLPSCLCLWLESPFSAAYFARVMGLSFLRTLTGSHNLSPVSHNTLHSIFVASFSVTQYLFIGPHLCFDVIIGLHCFFHNIQPSAIHSSALWEHSNKMHLVSSLYSLTGCCLWRHVLGMFLKSLTSKSRTACIIDCKSQQNVFCFLTLLLALMYCLQLHSVSESPLTQRVGNQLALLCSFLHFSWLIWPQPEQTRIMFLLVKIR